MTNGNCKLFLGLERKYKHETYTLLRLFYQVFVLSYSARGKGLVDHQGRERHGWRPVWLLYLSRKLHSALSEIVSLVFFGLTPYKVIADVMSRCRCTAKALAVELLRLNTPRSIKTAILTPMRYDELPRPFYMGIPPPGSRVYTNHFCDPLLGPHFVSDRRSSHVVGAASWRDTCNSAVLVFESARGRGWLVSLCLSFCFSTVFMGLNGTCNFQVHRSSGLQQHTASAEAVICVHCMWGVRSFARRVKDARLHEKCGVLHVEVSFWHRVCMCC